MHRYFVNRSLLYIINRIPAIRGLPVPPNYVDGQFFPAPWPRLGVDLPATRDGITHLTSRCDVFNKENRL